MLSKRECGEALQDEASRTLWSTISDGGDDRSDKKKPDAGRDHYTSGQKLLMEHWRTMVSERGRNGL